MQEPNEIMECINDKSLNALASDWQADVLQPTSRSHVGPLLGHGAGGVATQAVEWLNRILRAG